MRACLLVLALAGPATAATCESLTALSLPATTITLATTVSTDRWPNGIAVRHAEHPAFCRVAATLRPTPDSEIKIEVWMPSAAWNGNYEAVGNGGWSGSINHESMAAALTLADGGPAQALSSPRRSAL